MTTTTSRNGRGSDQGNSSSQLALAAVPPHNLEAERSVLGAMLLHGDPKYLLRLMERGLTANSFYRAFHGEVFNAMTALARRTEHIDHILVVDEMERQGTKQKDTAANVDELAGWVPAAGHFVEYANIVIELAEWRKRLTASYEMQAAAIKRDTSAWEEAFGLLAPADESERQANVIVLRTVTEDGEVVGETRLCPKCEEYKDEIKGLNRDLTTWRVRHANLERDKEAAARADGLWQLAQRLFELWKALTGHRRSEFMWDRFDMCAPYLRSKKYGPRMVARGIVGIAYDPFTPTRRNGTKKKLDGWDKLFKNTDAFEEYCNCAPKDWEERIPESHRPFVLGPEEEPVKPAQQLLSAVGER